MGKWAFACLLVVVALIPAQPVQAKGFHVLFDFKKTLGAPGKNCSKGCCLDHCPDGGNPAARLTADNDGNLYGTTEAGGNGDGTVFKLAPDGTETVLYDFCSQLNCADGANPGAGVVADKKGNLYGTTEKGGGARSSGTVFQLAPNDTETVLHSFCPEKGCADGSHPRAGVLLDKLGNLYGTTASGGASNYGTIFNIAPNGAFTTLYAFHGIPDGATPVATPVMDQAGNLYGTTAGGGNFSDTCLATSEGGCGTVFRFAADGTETILYSFCSQSNCADGAEPVSSLILDKQGNLYGTTLAGGSGTCLAGCGRIFELASDLEESVLHAFSGSKDGAAPESGLTLDDAGSFYGTTCGKKCLGKIPTRNCTKNCEYGDVYRLLSDEMRPDSFEVIHSFNLEKGATPEA